MKALALHPTDKIKGYHLVLTDLSREEITQVMRQLGLWYPDGQEDRLVSVGKKRGTDE